jgi:hypothetical protein
VEHPKSARRKTAQATSKIMFLIIPASPPFP